MYFWNVRVAVWSFVAQRIPTKQLPNVGTKLYWCCFFACFRATFLLNPALRTLPLSPEIPSDVRLFDELETINSLFREFYTLSGPRSIAKHIHFWGLLCYWGPGIDAARFPKRQKRYETTIFQMSPGTCCRRCPRPEALTNHEIKQTNARFSRMCGWKTWIILGDLVHKAFQNTK